MKERLEPKSVKLDMSATDYFPILGGPPESMTMRSGLVVLGPAQSVGRHSTEGFEEMIIVLEGEGELLIDDGSILRLGTRTVAYCPPETEHDVRNCGIRTLRYIYVVAKAL
jgi:mannose-6-phosphate isomerase-like protein (cupin superfamily)